jgi:hypothetical protein
MILTNRISRLIRLAEIQVLRAKRLVLRIKSLASLGNILSNRMTQILRRILNKFIRRCKTKRKLFKILKTSFLTLKIRKLLTLKALRIIRKK